MVVLDINTGTSVVIFWARLGEPVSRFGFHSIDDVNPSMLALVNYDQMRSILHVWRVT